MTVLSTGHEKMRITVALTARHDGKKMKPYVLINRKKPIKAITDKFKGLVLNFAGTTWMNDQFTEDYLHKVIGCKMMFGKKRLLAWDAFGAHKSDSTKKILRELDVEPLYIPGGCTKFIQV